MTWSEPAAAMVLPFFGKYYVSPDLPKNGRQMLG
jgi:hypothetical protein